MGAPTSSILSEIYLQYLENTEIFDILLKHHIIGYFRYVDDILIVYKNGMTNIHDMLVTVNKITPTMTFTMEEVNNSINFLDITISTDEHKISFNVYRKPTATDIIPSDSCHPPEQKLAGIRYLLIVSNTHQHSPAKPPCLNWCIISNHTADCKLCLAMQLW